MILPDAPLYDRDGLTQHPSTMAWHGMALQAADWLDHTTKKSEDEHHLLSPNHAP
ncbi:hypothetical protein OIN59_08020 [Acidovorax sp. D2M1]|uniref:Uncharacterized protein n=1 Tax=Acidovorax benzenivorans TaxID=2987520 RepID=A0ABT5RUK1_9BURK|nr:hypothetical protein [Acidovorax benzenivorans]MDD2177380.1 hypothetical protein [Acidovorax benzenivorans]